MTDALITRNLTAHEQGLAYDVLMEMPSTGIRHNLVTDAFLDALDSESEMVTLHAADLQALRAARDSLPAGEDRAILTDIVSLFTERAA